VVAIEPMPISFACLQHNLGPEALCLNIAASDVNGAVIMGQDDNLGASRIREDGEWTVPCHALDDLPDLPAPEFCKIDAEGHEVRVLRGMRGILERHRPIVFVEANEGALNQQGFTRAHIDLVFAELGYKDVLCYPKEAKADWPQFDLLFLP
jgi:FkbM family methyltransferase